MAHWKKWVGVVVLTAICGCHADQQTDSAPNMAAYRDRMLAEAQRPQPVAGSTPKAREWRHKQEPVITLSSAADGDSDATSQPAKRALPTSVPASQPTAEDIFSQIPDPTMADTVFETRLAELRRTTREERIVAAYERVARSATESLRMLARSQRRELSLAECIQRALQSNYTIRTEAYNPAIAETQVVQAESVFDAAFFLDAGRQNLDRAHPPQIPTAQSDGWNVEGGIRKLLPTGMTASASVRQTRNFVDGVSGRVTPYNPAYDTLFIADLRQPLLRGFGLDYNRRNITLSQIGREISVKQFRRQVRDTLLDVERAYWRLSQARRLVSILAESVAQNFVTYQDIDRLQVYKATPVQLYNAKARYEQRYVVLLESIKNVRDAEDRLKNLMNDPEFKLSHDLEIIPTESLFVAPLVLDQFAEVRAAVDRRAEIDEAKLNVEQARVRTAAAKNETLPQLDLAFHYEVEGLEDDPGNSFDNMTMERYRSYTVGVQFQQQFGNRGPRAALRQSQLRESQAIVDVQRVTDLVVEEVNIAVRTLGLRYEQIPPQVEAAKAAALNLRSLQTRTETVDPSYLETELNGVEQLANARQNLVGVVTDYTITLAELEKAKGTLLEYDNVAISDEPRR